ncbi:unnamed protein product [Paramecium pentaurelia]|uniref:Ubiquitin carboxyl-terminal hydrolase n=1 Tax=Paramecium pentaurelia TaxID=43138 RepID=A0A8S1T229_9CILI|nr:unnamed protein product [Paramecium pentaurelia]
MISYTYQTGLANFGNTCFMNSAIQILCNTPGFADYILNDIYQFDINLINPQGSNGEIIQSFAYLIKELKSRKQLCIIANLFKKTFSKFYNIYYGNEQHDAAEFLLQLLDAINEDVNLIKKKPYLIMPSSKGREDLVVAIEQWDVHSQRNQSIITQLFQAQFKSKIECPNCKNMSITFDPYMIIQLPLTTQKSEKGIVYYLLDDQYKQKQMTLSVFKNYNFEWIQNEIRNQLRTQALIFNLSNKVKNYEIRPEDDIQYLKQQLLHSKLLVRPMQFQEIQIPYNYRCYTLITHTNPEFFNLTEIITIIFDFRTKIFEIYDFIEKNYSQQFQCQFDLFLESNSQETEQQCYFCHKQYCKFCELKKCQHSLKYYNNCISQPNFQLNIIVKWYGQGVPQIYNTEASIFLMQDKNEQFPINKTSLTIYDCLNFQQQQQQLDENNSWYCNQCNQHVQGIKQLLLYSTPQILIIQLKRFKSSDNISQKIKNNIFVKFPHILNMSKYVTNLNLPNDYLNGNNKNELKYKLYGVINHYGELYEGHYNSLIKNLEDQKWYCYDDSQVKEIQVQDIITQHAYVLCYERQN